MKVLVALLGLASVALASVPLDTPEVAAAKAAHFAAHAAARGHLWHPVLYAGHYAHGAAPLGPGGVVVDTPEVAAAKAQHYHAHAAARTGAAVIPGVHAAGVVVPAGVVVKAEDDGQWHGEGLLESQDLSSAPVVAAAPVVHAAVHAAPVASAWHAYGHGARWVGPIALPSGYDANGAPLPVQDTPEVAAAKANHLAILNNAHAGAHAGIHHDVYSGQWNSALWGDHTHRWRRSAVLLRTPAATSPLVHTAYAVHTPLVHHHVTPLVRSWGYSSVAPIHHIW